MLLAGIPLINLYFCVYLLWLKPGSPGPNRFGESPI